MFRRIRTLIVSLCVLLPIAGAGFWANAGDRPDDTHGPLVVTSILPVHSLAMNVMEGVGAPVLLISRGPRHTSLPCVLQMPVCCPRARLVFWIGECGERALIKPLDVLASGTDRKVVALIEDAALTPLRQRPHRGFGKPKRLRRQLIESRAAQIPISGLPLILPRLLWRSWFGSSAFLILAMRRLMSRMAKDIERLKKMDEDVSQKLAPIRGYPFIVYHDAFQYFEAYYGMRAIGAVAASAEVAPGVRLVRQLRDTIREFDVKCVFTEPQFSPVLVQTLIADTQAMVWELDPIGASIPAGKDAYFRLMENLGKSLATCLERSP